MQVESTDKRLVEAARAGDVRTLAALLDAHPDKLHLATEPYAWTLLHHAADQGRLNAVDFLLTRGLDPDVREKGDNTTPMHWAAARGHPAVVRRLAAAGGDVVGKGDDHEGEVIGWATCGEGCDDAAHREVVAFLLSRGARHHVFSAIAMNLAGEVRRLVADDPAALRRTMSHNENHQLPLHFAVRMNRPEMAALLLDLGADPEAKDDGGLTALMYAAMPEVRREVLEALARHGATSLFGALALGEQGEAARRLSEAGGVIEPGTLHLVAKRGVASAARWLLERGADPTARWGHWDAQVAPLHLAAAEGHADVVRVLLEAGADPSIRDSKHDGDAAGWARYGRKVPAANWREIVKLLGGRGERAG